MTLMKPRPSTAARQPQREGISSAQKEDSDRVPRYMLAHICYARERRTYSVTPAHQIAHLIQGPHQSKQSDED